MPQVARGLSLEATVGGNQQDSQRQPIPEPQNNGPGRGREAEEGGELQVPPWSRLPGRQTHRVAAAAAGYPRAMGCTRDAILEALENLTAEELKKFKLKLLSVPLREGYGRIPRGTLLSMDAVDLTDKLVSYYLEEYGAELTALVLRNMGMQETAEQLQEITRKGPEASSVGIKATPLKADMPALHFVDQHRAALIARVTDVDGVLDALHSKVLTEEQYQAVRAETTNPMKMRRLFSFAPAWNLACKDLLLQALRDSQPYLVADLES